MRAVGLVKIDLACDLVLARLQLHIRPRRVDHDDSTAVHARLDPVDGVFIARANTKILVICRQPHNSSVS